MVVAVAAVAAVAAASTVSSADTWGLSGPTFLAIYACLLGAAGVAALAWRRWVRRGAVADAPLHPVELAYLIGGPDHATITAFVGLCRQGAVRVAEGPPVAPGSADPAADPPVGPGSAGGAVPRLLPPVELLDLTEGRRPVVAGPARGHALEAALAAELGRQPDRSELLAVMRASPTMAAVRERLVALGLVEDGAAARTLRSGSLLPLALVLALGVVRLVAGTSNGKPVGYLILLMLLTGGLMCLAQVVPRHPPAARALIARARKDQRRSPEAEERADELRKRGTFEVRDAEATPDPATVAALGPAVAWAAAPVLLASAGFAPPDFTIGTEFNEIARSGWSCGDGWVGGGGGGGGCGG